MLFNFKCSFYLKQIFYMTFIINGLYGLNPTIMTKTTTTTTVPPHLMKTQDGYIIENSLQGSEQDIRLEDFFWTGSGDGPPPYIRKPIAGLSESTLGSGYIKETFIKTSTVVATVYIDGDSESNSEPLCLENCDDTNAYPSDYLPSDRRFWLLTVVAGYFRPDDFPLIEDKLAKLYRVAFSRQQSWHLGIVNTTIIQMNSTAGQRRKRNIISKNNIVSVRIIPYDKLIQFTKINKNPDDNNGVVGDTTINEMNIKQKIFKRNIINGSQVVASIPPSSSPAFVFRKNVDVNHSPSISASSSSSPTLTKSSTINKNDENLKLTINTNQQRVSVHIHNVTIFTENDLKNIENAGKGSSIDKKISTPILNQTEIIYTVFVNGRPVLATTASEDMKLISDYEVSQVMEKPIFTKSEPYLKEPLATPLVPSGSTYQNSQIIGYITENPLLFILGIIVILLLIILLIGLLVMTRAKHTKNTEAKRLSSRQALITPKIDTNNQTIEDIDAIRSADNNNGIDNQGYDRTIRNESINANKRSVKKKTGIPVLHFPHPPSTSPNSTSTSDSSIYYPKKHTEFDVQNILDEKSLNVFNKKSKHNNRKHTYKNADIMNTDAVYATITKKSERKHKPKRKYIGENRVGSIEGDAVHNQSQSSRSSASSELFEINNHQIINDKSNNVDRNESIQNQNILDQYHKNKLLHDRHFINQSKQHRRTITVDDLSRHIDNAAGVEDGGGDVGGDIGVITDHEDDDDYDLESPTEAYNKDILKALKIKNRSSGGDSGGGGSIGSFLSMASIRSFPKCFVPEPLSRVLEPVSVTHLDVHYDNHRTINDKHINNNNKHPKIIEMKHKIIKTIKQTPINSLENKADGDIDMDIGARRKPNPDFTNFNRSQSDGADPGVIGPVVWEIHKRNIEKNELSSPVRDPLKTRTRFEGLLEGAIKLYTDNDDSIMSTNNDVPGVIKHKDNRGKSAMLMGTADIRSGGFNHRPVTAGALKTLNEHTTTEPPSPYRKAWGSGTPSPLVRPLSAGPFHRPEPPIIDVTRVLAPQNIQSTTQLSTAPLIEAIQNELKKFNQKEN